MYNKFTVSSSEDENNNTNLRIGFAFFILAVILLFYLMVNCDDFDHFCGYIMFGMGISCMLCTAFMFLM